MSRYQKVREELLGEEYYSWRHKSGLTVYVIPKAHSTTYALFGTRFGSQDVCFRTEADTEVTELPDGVAHFLEHKMFEDENGVDAFTRFALTGASANAFTTFGRTCYLFSCTERFDENLEILLDFVSHPFFSKETIQKEQGIIGEEIAMYDDNPGWCVFANLLKALYHKNSIRNSIAGTKASIAKITPEMLYRCTDTFYDPHNMALTVCGPVTPEQVDAICGRMLGGAASEKNVIRIPYAEPEEVCTPLIEQSFEIAQPIVEIGFKDTPVDDPCAQMRIAAANAITFQLLFGKSGHFYNTLYEQELICGDKFGASYMQERNASFTEISACCTDPFALKDAICAELDARKSDFFTEEEFAVAKRVVYANHLFSFDSVDDIANTFMAFWASGGDCFTYARMLTEITRDEAWEIFCRTVRTDRCAMSVIYPKARKEESV